MTCFPKCCTADWRKSAMEMEKERVISRCYWVVDRFLKIPEIVLGRPVQVNVFKWGSQEMLGIAL